MKTKKKNQHIYRTYLYGLDEERVKMRKKEARLSETQFAMVYYRLNRTKQRVQWKLEGSSVGQNIVIMCLNSV